MSYAHASSQSSPGSSWLEISSVFTLPFFNLKKPNHFIFSLLLISFTALPSYVCYKTILINYLPLLQYQLKETLLFQCSLFTYCFFTFQIHRSLLIFSLFSLKKHLTYLIAQDASLPNYRISSVVPWDGRGLFSWRSQNLKCRIDVNLSWMFNGIFHYFWRY